MSGNNNLISNMTWKFAERISAQLVSTIVSIILARLLEPEHYGLIAIVMVFITIANVLVAEGLGSALIQKKNVDALDFSSVLYFNLLFSIVVYLVLYICAPYIGNFYGSEYAELPTILRVLGLRIILASINSVQNAYVSHKMMFEKFFWATLIGTSGSAVIGLYMAINGYGVWALVAQYMSNGFINTITLCIVLRKRPLNNFSIDRLKNLIGYGSKILCSSMIITVFEEFRALLIGKMYSSVDLAFYEKAQQFPKLVIVNVNSSISSVLFPKMSLEQDDVYKLKQLVRSSIRFSTYVMCPMMLGLAAIGENFIHVVLTDKWIESLGMMRVFCIYYLFQPIHSANIQAIKALGRSDIYLNLEIIKKIIEIIVLVIVINVSVNFMVVSMAVLASIFAYFNAYPNKRLLNYSFIEQINDVIPSLCLTSIMVVLVTAIGTIDVDRRWLLTLQIIAGITIYISLSVLTNNKEFYSLLKYIKSKR